MGMMCCTGSSCRSPIAEAAARRWLQANRPGMGDRVASRGLVEYWVSSRKRPFSQAIQAASELGLDTSEHTPQLISPEELSETAVVFGMTKSHVRALEAIIAKADRKPELLTLSSRNIVDPYGASLDTYRTSAKMI